MKLSMIKNNICRNLTLEDNLQQVAELIYKTDPYIYPTWFKHYDSWKDVLVKLIRTEGSVFNYKNIIVAVLENNIIGILIYLNENTDLNFNYNQYIKVNRYFKFTINKYISRLKDNLKPNVVYIPNICVDEKYRNLNIATNLIEFIKHQYYDSRLVLHCLKNNFIALKLYKKTNFKIIKEMKGFNSPYKIKPKIYEMIYSPED